MESDFMMTLLTRVALLASTVADQAFIPFYTTGTVVHFESRVPTEWEKTHLPIILLTSEDWNPSQEVFCVTGTKATNSRKCGLYNPLHLG
jgi:hypothetical protein